jgi:hypothetical protein
MARKYQKRIQRANAVALANGGNPANTEFPRIRELIAGRHSKAAVQLAKDLHKRAGTTESEALLRPRILPSPPDFLQVPSPQ